MAENKTRETEVSVTDFIQSVDHATRRADAVVLDEMFRRITGWTPKMWGPTIIGYGSYHYVYESGREGDSLACGFSPRKASQSIYVIPGYQDYGHILDRLGKYKIGKSCLYITKLADVDMDVLEELCQTGLEDLKKKYPVVAT
jgi:hypothetical protein